MTNGISDELVAYTLAQWKRRGIIADAASAREWLAGKSTAFVDGVEARRKAGWQVPKLTADAAPPKRNRRQKR